MFKVFFRSLPTLFLECWRGRNLLWHFLAIALTYVLVISGFDWWYFEQTRSVLFHPIVFIAGIGGFFVPVLVPVGLYVIGELKGRTDFILAASGTARGVILASVIAAFYKAFTGRIQPEFLTYTSSVDISKDFNFGFFEHGIFWGWPSSHAAVAFALVTVLMVTFPRNLLVRYAGALYVCIIALGASVGFHWFSDVLAGAIIGMMIGVIVARRVLYESHL